MSDIADLVRAVRRKIRDSPVRTRITDAAGIDNAVQTISLPVGQAILFPDPNRYFEFDDGTDERAYSEDIGDTNADQLTNVQRGVDGTTAVQHALGCPILIDPRFSFAEIADVVNRIVDLELWPQSWVPGESSLAWQAPNEYYPSPVPGVERIVYAYQLVNGVKYRIHAELLPAPLADNANFPNGAITIRDTSDTSTIFFAYRARATLGTLTTTQQHLVTLGAAGQLMISEEAEHVRPAPSYIDRRVADGAKARAGQLLWQDFQQGLQREFINLLSDEDAAGRDFTRRM
jgi:hypothetical protein